MMDWADSGWSWWWVLSMMVFMLLLVGAGIGVVVAVVRPNETPTLSAHPTAEEILKERFARGEIDAAEYRERLDALHASAPSKC
jgi:putative membrane protein